MVSSDSTISCANNKGAAALKAALLEELRSRSTAANATIHNGAKLDDIRANMRSMSWTPPPGSCETRCRVMIWNGNELCVH
eukprot:8676834-Pyramimonas_sp.AAC.1